MRRAVAPLIWLSAAIGLAAVLVIAAWLYVSRGLDAPGPLDEPRTIQLAEGLGAWAIADALAAAGIVDDANVFAAGVWLEGSDKALKAGEYRFEPHVSPREVMAALETGATVVHRVTVAEGLTSAGIVALLGDAEALEGELAAVPPDGALLPETYHFSRGDSRAELVRRMTVGMEAALEALWPERDPGIALETPAEAVILASIVEKETGVAAERPMIAAVFHNRLRKRMPLQSDPTVIYAVTGGAPPLDRPLSRADLRIENPYNTYRNKGLPPGPIANPGRAAIQAVLQPAKTDALYFVADGSGGHAFARTLAEHNRNVARWRKIRAAGAGGS